VAFRRGGAADLGGMGVFDPAGVARAALEAARDACTRFVTIA
jgi:hypothetical protein